MSGKGMGRPAKVENFRGEAGVFGLLQKAAAAGLPCPSDAEMAEALGFWVRVHMERLEAKGLIRVEKSNRNSRAVVIVATGQRTAPTQRNYGGVAKSASARMEDDAGLMIPVPRDLPERDAPCARCAVRRSMHGASVHRFVEGIRA